MGNIALFFFRKEGGFGVFVIFVECIVGGRGSGKITIANETEKGGYGIFGIFVVFSVRGREWENGKIKFAITKRTEYQKSKSTFSSLLVCLGHTLI